jgi:hypothetical protein
MGDPQQPVHVYDHLPARVRRRITGPRPHVFTDLSTGLPQCGQHPLPARRKRVDHPGLTLIRLNAWWQGRALDRRHTNHFARLELALAA